MGKSSILQALNFFKEPTYRLRIEDNYNKDLSLQLEVSITFFDLGEGEKEEFDSKNKSNYRKSHIQLLSIFF